MLRSLYAEAETDTFVEMTFEYRCEIYKIRRSPTYMRPVKRGTGMTESKHSAELTLPGGKIVTGSTAVTTEIIDILGIDKNQFSQIAMIAQGDFQKVLTASTDERQGIFRKVFNTGRYERLQERLEKEVKRISSVFARQCFLRFRQPQCGATDLSPTTGNPILNGNHRRSQHDHPFRSRRVNPSQ